MVAVLISYYGEAETIQVAGDFSDGGGASWQPEHLTNRGEGIWSLVLNLLPGSYHYKLIVDGEWRLVEGQEVEADALGHFNSILVVGEQEVEEEETGGGILEEALEEEADGGKLKKGHFEQTLEVSLNDTPADAYHFNILHSEANASFGICLDVSNDLFDASVDLTVKDDEGTPVVRGDEVMQTVQPVEVEAVAPEKVLIPDAKEDQIKVKRVALVGKRSSDEGQGPAKTGHTKILSTTQKVLTSSSALPPKVKSKPRENQQSMKGKAVAPAVPVKTASKFLERDLKKSASKVAEAPAKTVQPSRDGSGKKPNAGNKENVCQQLLNMSLKAKEVKGKESNGTKLGTYKGLVVRNRTINAESDDDDQQEDKAQSEGVLVEKAFVVSSVTKKDNVAQSRRATKGLLTKTSRPWKRV